MNYTATYSPDDNKLRLYAGGRLPPEIYERVKAAGFRWAPHQELFVAPMWTPQREDLLIELAGQIDDEDKSLTERAEERAERFEDYSEKRSDDAAAAHRAVSSIADNIPLGQPILIGHHSEKHARRDAEKIENGMRRAVKMWETSQYWTYRAAGAIRHAKHKERPDVRARRIKGIEADLRKLDRSDKESAATLGLWALVDKPEKWKPGEGAPQNREERAAYIAGRVHCNVSRKNESGSYWTAFDVLRLPVEERYKAAPVMTVDEVIADVRASLERATAYRNRWREHYKNRLAYERAMLADSGGTVADRTGPEVGGAVQCLWGPRGGWAYIFKVNKVTITVRHQWNQGGRVFNHNEPLDKLRAVMTRAQVEEARAQGRIKEAPEGIGFWLLQSREEFDKAEAEREKAGAPELPTTEETPPAVRDFFADHPEVAKANAATFEAMKESLRAGVQVVTANQLFPTPAELAARMVDLARIPAGARVLEPSAGTGAILRALPGILPFAGPKRQTWCEVHAVELNHALAEQLEASGLATATHRGDFLQMNGALGTFDRVLMNPPFQNADDIKHTAHALAMLKPGGRLVGICANGPRQNEKLRPLVEESGGTWEPLPADTFRGTGVNAVLFTIEKADA